MTAICMLITIVDRGKGAAAAQTCRAEGMHASLALRGHGTANSEIMDMLGLDEPEKELLLSLGERSQCRKALAALAAKLRLDRPGTGIAFICPLSGISLAAASWFDHSAQAQREEETHMEAHPLEMILLMVDSGSTDLVVDAAKAAGARGGTVLKAREIIPDEQKTIFGITVQPEKEIVALLVPAQEKKHIFQSACAAVLQQTGEHAVGVSLPVSDAVGLKL